MSRGLFNFDTIPEEKNNASDNDSGTNNEQNDLASAILKLAEKNTEQSHDDTPSKIGLDRYVDNEEINAIKKHFTAEQFTVFKTVIDRMDADNTQTMSAIFSENDKNINNLKEDFSKTQVKGGSVDVKDLASLLGMESTFNAQNKELIESSVRELYGQSPFSGDPVKDFYKLNEKAKNDSTALLKLKSVRDDLEKHWQENNKSHLGLARSATNPEGMNYSEAKKVEKKIEKLTSEKRQYIDKPKGSILHAERISQINREIEELQLN